MDPLSIIASTAAITDLSVQILKVISETKKGVDTADEDLLHLVRDVEKTRDVSDLIRKAFQDDLTNQRNMTRGGGDATSGMWSVASSTLTGCVSALTTIQTVINQIRGEDGLSRFERLKNISESFQRTTNR